jgi:hypothetical protein
MYISRVRLENIRRFSGRRNVDLTLTRPDGSHAGWTVLAGRNESGKTSLLRTIALTVGGPVVARSLTPDFRAWKTVGMPEPRAQLQFVAAPEDLQPGSDTQTGLRASCPGALTKIGRRPGQARSRRWLVSLT